MIAIKLDGKLSTAAGGSLERHASSLYSRPGARLVGVVELRHVERTQPAPDEDKEASVKLRITGLEIANDEQEDTIRRAMEALYIHRSSRGTLDEDGAVELADQTLRLTEGMLHAIEAARLQVGARAFAEQCRRALAVQGATAAELRHELEAVAKGLERVLRGEPAEDAS